MDIAAGCDFQLTDALAERLQGGDGLTVHVLHRDLGRE